MTAYSRRLKTEERKNKKRAVFFAILTVLLVIGLIIYGVPLVANFAAFLGNVRQTSELPDITDNTPPPPPRFDILPSATSNNELDISGTTEAGATVKLNFNNESVEILANNDGQFSHNVKLKEGANRLSAIAVDNSGNESGESDTIFIEYDKEPPSLEIKNPGNNSEFYGSRQRQITIEGTTDPQSKIQINDRFVVVNSDGSFSFTTTLNEGSNEFTIIAEDEAGNKVEKSLSVSFTP